MVIFVWVVASLMNGIRSLKTDVCHWKMIHENGTSTSNNDENAELVWLVLSHNRQLSVKMLTEQLQMSKGSIQTILHEVLRKKKKKKVYSKFVPEFVAKKAALFSIIYSTHQIWSRPIFSYSSDENCHKRRAFWLMWRPFNKMWQEYRQAFQKTISPEPSNDYKSI